MQVRHRCQLIVEQGEHHLVNIICKRCSKRALGRELQPESLLLGRAFKFRNKLMDGKGGKRSLLKQFIHPYYLRTRRRILRLSHQTLRELLSAAEDFLHDLAGKEMKKKKTQKSCVSRFLPIGWKQQKGKKYKENGRLRSPEQQLHLPPRTCTWHEEKETQTAIPDAASKQTCSIKTRQQQPKFHTRMGRKIRNKGQALGARITCFFFTFGKQPVTQPGTGITIRKLN